MDRNSRIYPHKATVERICAICNKPLEPNEHYLELWRPESAQGKQRLELAGVECSIQAIQRWLTKKRKATRSSPAE